jgi:hypothetical protein
MDYNASHDPILTHIIRTLSRSSGAGLTITLHVNGMTICGQLIGGKDYTDLLGDVVVDNMHDADAAASWRDYLSTVGDVNLEAAQAHSEDAPFNPEYLHLKDAYHHSAGGWQPDKGMLWRGKIAEIDGWYFGAWRPSK